MIEGHVPLTDRKAETCRALDLESYRRAVRAGAATGGGLVGSGDAKTGRSLRRAFDDVEKNLQGLVSVDFAASGRGHYPSGLRRVRYQNAGHVENRIGGVGFGQHGRDLAAMVRLVVEQVGQKHGDRIAE